MATNQSFASAYRSAWPSRVSVGESDLAVFHERVSHLGLAGLYSSAREFEDALELWSSYWLRGTTPDDLGNRLVRDGAKDVVRTMKSFISFWFSQGVRNPKWVKLPVKIDPVEDNPLEARLVSREVLFEDVGTNYLDILFASLAVEDEFLDDDGDLVRSRTVDGWLKRSDDRRQFDLLVGDRVLGQVELPEPESHIAKALELKQKSIVGSVSLQLVDGERYINFLMYFPR